MSEKLQTPLIQLQGAIDQRVQQEAEFAARFLQGTSDEEKALSAAIKLLQDQRQTWLDGLEQHYQQAASSVTDEINDLLIDAEGQFQAATGDIARARDAERDEVESKFQDSTWVIVSPTRKSPWASAFSAP